ncbi:MAG: tyrosine--tRNA ligase [Candidatus Magnetominusculus sp. LBB02]|nr:tyrosine--tRNA ligase [Candidatus Magnetominusculus sp. LBB02]
MPTKAIRWLKVFDSPKKQLEEIKRGVTEIISEEELLNKLSHSQKENRPLKIKAGFDPTAPDIHLGHTVLIEKMRHFQELGHEVIFLIGDYTGMIGDPTGKNEIRKTLSKEEVELNAQTYKEQIFKILDPKRTQVVFNSEWFSKMSAHEIAGLGALMTVARMIERDDFKKRFEAHSDISLLEFYYPLFQGYDSVALKADVELGGTDQRFNLLMGRTLQRKYAMPEQVVIMMPLLEGLDGVNKMSKSLGNYVGINEPAKEIYGKLMSITDELMLKYYELLSHISGAELKLTRDGLANGDVHPKKAKEDLAFELTQRYHGKEAALQAKAEFNLVFGSKEIPADIAVFAYEWTEPEVWLPKILKDTGLCESTGAAIRLINQGGVKIDDRRPDGQDERLKAGEYVLKVGKRKFLRIKPL